MARRETVLYITRDITLSAESVARRETVLYITRDITLSAESVARRETVLYITRDITLSAMRDTTDMWTSAEHTLI